ncbi:MAG TPA: sigma-70 family RNA polymerase sigma factor [Candidatus Sulfotelmatobacter sp.]|jgi:RNA polymerase sigma-70 factor (ECF subfamily)
MDAIENTASEIEVRIAEASDASGQDALYEDAAKSYGPALERLGRAYEADPELRRDLLQEIHVALWRSLAKFDHRCSLRTWIYRVAHNVGASHIASQRRTKLQTLVDLEELENLPDTNAGSHNADRSHALDRLLNLIQRLKPLDRHVILSYLEGLDAASIAEITGLSPGNVATKIHRIKNVLARQFQQGETK